MNDRPGPGAGNIIAGIFLILFGLCLTLLGGGCTLLWISEMGPSYGGTEALPLLLVSIAILGAGVVLIWVGAKLMRGGFNR